MIAALVSIALAAQTPPAGPPVTLAHQFKKGEESKYGFESTLVAETKPPGVLTFLPRSYGFEYTFTTKVNDVDQDGNARLRYDRPKTVMVQGEFGDEPEVRAAEKGGDIHLNVRVSSINEILEVAEVKPAEGGTKPGGSTKPGGRFNLLTPNPLQSATQQIAGQFVSQFYRIALMVGSLDSGLDFSPKLPIVPVRPGQTWKKTVGYSPQNLAGSSRQAVQRLDYTYTYVGLADSNGKPVQRITAALDLETDLGTYVNQLFGTKPAESGIKGLLVKFHSVITYDLDPTTFRTIRATANSEGSTKLDVTFQTTPYEEEKFTAQATLKLLQVK